MMSYLLPVKLALAGLLGSFRGGEVLPTGHTVLTRTIWAGVMSLLALSSPPLHFNIYEFVALWVGLEAMMYIPHAFAQNGTTENMWEMAGIGAARGVVLVLALIYWHTSWIVPVVAVLGMAFVQSISYIIGYAVMTVPSVKFLDGPTKLAEFIWGIGLMAILNMVI